jgi:organic radical activating enzyme
MSDRYFPIKTQTACQLKWTWSTLFLNKGTTSSCHRVKKEQITAETFDSFHNTPKKIEDRTLMLDGQWPTGGCEYCSSIEKAGGSSDRMMHLKIPNLVPPELDHTPNEIFVTPRIVEVYFDNVCNMSCLYCDDEFSSKIYQENQKFGPFEKHGILIKNQTKQSERLSDLTQAFWRWLDKNYTQVFRLHVLGGEPFYQPQFETMLDFFESHPSPHLELNVISNLKISRSKLTAYVEKIKKLVAERKLKRFDLTASIDCFGKEQEYVRHGMNLEQWKENFNYLVDQRWITLNINQTLTGLTIKTVPELIDHIKQIKKNRKIGHHFSIVKVGHYEFLHPGIFGTNFFTEDFDRILAIMPDDTQWDQYAKTYMNGIKMQIESCSRDQEKIQQLGTYLDELDRRRNLNWRTTFPWLEKEINHVV